ncbi:unnamed protein product [Mesocestoides corti]|uniref:Uncharacterized protein n=1 Tax=Mesocestoides corti TaxID=53468 RepID=A0A0R3U3B7_MESCO|nr:unnamed protein product [Mesocestoides corti]
MHRLVVLLVTCGNLLIEGHVVSWSSVRGYSKAVVVNTWPLKEPNDAAWSQINKPMGSAVAAVVAGCSVAEANRSIYSVGPGGSPDENGTTTLDAMVGAVAAMPEIREAIKVAEGVLRFTRHTLLAGESAARFAESLGFKRTNLSSNESIRDWKAWKDGNCQPNFRIPSAWIPDPKSHCGPYHGKNRSHVDILHYRPELGIDETNHDTIGMIALDRRGRLAVGLSTNGARFRIPGRVGDSPIPGAGGYADSKVGAAVGTGDGDVMMRYLLTFRAVELMRVGKNATEACRMSLRSVRQRGTWYGALVAVRADGQYGGACVGFQNFAFVVQNANSARGGKVIKVWCVEPRDLLK